MEICPGYPEDIETELKKGGYDALFFFTPQICDEYIGFVKRISAEHPELVIYTTVLVESVGAAEILCKAGAKRCFAMPVFAGDICSTLAEDLSPFGEGLVLGKISDFLGRKHFARYMQGFRFMCIAVENSILDPSKIRDMEDRLYPYIAENMLTTPEFVEQEIARLRDNALMNRWEYEGYDGVSVLTNVEIVAASSDEFKTKYLTAV